MNHEHWRLVASGLFDQYLADIVAVTNRDARYRLIREGAFHGKALLDAYETLAYVPSTATLQEYDQYLADIVYNPTERSPVVTRPQNATAIAGVLACDAPPEGFTTIVYSWDYAVFTEVGDLSTSSSPGTGIYVLAHREIATANDGLPSQFLSI